ncbi:beta-defensin 126 [Pteropus medius]|uniref:beta-defensin 126 n=1 Tax=Pteropus vampyrus TaxID=132908 RepID=UPI00196AC90D|nr:beta-defensin 126 [Pteropus giganteus]
MKSLLLTLATFLLLAQLVSGSWYVKKCANRMGNCRSKCRTGEIRIQPPTGMCSKEKLCCILSGKDLNPLICADNVKTTTTAQGAVTKNVAPTENMASMATMATMASMGSMASMASMSTTVAAVNTNSRAPSVITTGGGVV